MSNMQRLTRAGVFSVIVAAALAAALPARADETATFTSGFVSDLRCPGAKPVPTRPPGIPRPTVLNTQIPTPGELGSLADIPMRDPPALDMARIPGFTLPDGSAPRKIAFWGDSHIAAGPFMGEVMKAIAAHRITVGTRFLPPTMGRANVRLPTLHAYCIGEGWSTALSFSAPDTIQVGPALANRIASASESSYLWIDFRNASLQPTLRSLKIAYRPMGSASLTMTVNDGAEQTVALTAGGAGTAFLTINADTAISTIRLKVASGTFVLEGFFLDYVQPPNVVFDVFGLPGSTARGWANADPNAIAQALGGETYDAVALEYGTNEGSDLKFDPVKYTANLTRTLQNMRSVFPNASCLLIGPPDRGILLAHRPAPPSTDYLQYARIHQQIAAVQTQVAPQFNCVHWSWQGYMGGPGGNYSWAYHDPAYMGHDLTHLTQAGYIRTGQALATSLGWMSGLFPE